MGESKFKVEGVVGLDQALEYMRQLISQLEKGRVAVKSAEKAMVAQVPQLVEFELEIEEKKGKREISVEIEWKDSMVAGEGLDLLITSPDDPELASCERTELAAQTQPACAEQ